MSALERLTLGWLSHISKVQLPRPVHFYPSLDAAQCMHLTLVGVTLNNSECTSRETRAERHSTAVVFVPHLCRPPIVCDAREL